MIPGGRKFVFSMSALILTFVLALLGKLTPEFATSLSILTMMFHGAHVVQDWGKGKSGGAAS